MTNSHTGPLPYDMGNAGDLLKHGILAEFLRTYLTFERSRSVRFLDLFAGEPFSPVTCNRITQRVDRLSGCALREAQSDIHSGRYYGSGLVARHIGEQYGGRMTVIVGDCDQDRQERLRQSELRTFDTEFPDFDNPSGYDAYDALRFIRGRTTNEDLVLIDPFACFLPDRAKDIIPILGQIAKCSTVIMFALNLDPFNPVGLCFDDLLKTHLNGALVMTCPPLRRSKIRGERKYYAEVVLSSPVFSKCSAEFVYLQNRLEYFAFRLADALELPEPGQRMLVPRVIGQGSSVMSPELMRNRKDRMDEILEYCNSAKIRVSYGAAADMLNVDQLSVGKLLGERRPEASWIVSKKTGRPTGYAKEQVHKDLLKNSRVICNARELENELRKA